MPGASEAVTTRVLDELFRRKAVLALEDLSRRDVPPSTGPPCADLPALLRRCGEEAGESAERRELLAERWRLRRDIAVGVQLPLFSGCASSTRNCCLRVRFTCSTEILNRPSLGHPPHHGANDSLGVSWYMFFSFPRRVQINDLLPPGKELPDVSSILDRFRDAFDWSEADRNGQIIPREGCDPEYDATCSAIEEIESSLKQYLKEQWKLLRHASLNYVNVGKDMYLIEVSENLGGSVPEDLRIIAYSLIQEFAEPLQKKDIRAMYIGPNETLKEHSEE